VGLESFSKFKACLSEAAKDFIGILCHFAGAAQEEQTCKVVDDTTPKNTNQPLKRIAPQSNNQQSAIIKMKLYLSLLLPTLTGITAFVPSSHQSPHAVSTALHQYSTRSLGFETSNLYSEAEIEQARKQVKITNLLRKSRTATAIRGDLGSKVLVSGFTPSDPSASMVLDFLNSEDASYFKWNKIVAHVPDVVSAKKRMIGRNARYTGLLDKLDFVAEKEGSKIPTAEQLDGVSSWVVHVANGELDMIKQVVEVAEAVDSVKNVAILVSGAGSVSTEAMKESNEMLLAQKKSYTLVAVPEWNDQPEALCAYGIRNVTDVSEAPFVTGETFSREESLRIVTECLAVEGARGKCVVANASTDKKSVESMLIQGMRESGFSRIEEVAMMVMNGSQVSVGFVVHLSYRFHYLTWLCLHLTTGSNGNNRREKARVRIWSRQTIPRRKSRI
jgi:hypothetical protein